MFYLNFEESSASLFLYFPLLFSPTPYLFVQFIHYSFLRVSEFSSVVLHPDDMRSIDLIHYIDYIIALSFTKKMAKKFWKWNGIYD